MGKEKWSPPFIDVGLERSAKASALEEIGQLSISLR